MSDKKFDAVAFMRQVRDKMGSDMKEMTLEEQRAYIEQHASKIREELSKHGERGQQRRHKESPAGARA